MPVSVQEYDPDRHCGVWNNDANQHCTRSLTCKVGPVTFMFMVYNYEKHVYALRAFSRRATYYKSYHENIDLCSSPYVIDTIYSLFPLQAHALSLRRAVTGRSNSFDQLLKDHKEAKDALLRAKGKLPPATTPTASATTSTPTPTTPQLNKQKSTPSLGSTHGSSVTPVHNKTTPLQSPNLSLTPTGLLMKSPPVFSHHTLQRDPDRERTSTPIQPVFMSKLGKAASAKLIPSPLLPR